MTPADSQETHDLYEGALSELESLSLRRNAGKRLGNKRKNKREKTNTKPRNHHLHHNHTSVVAPQPPSLQIPETLPPESVRPSATSGGPLSSGSGSQGGNPGTSNPGVNPQPSTTPKSLPVGAGPGATTAIAVPVTTEIFQPQISPFPVEKWKSPLPVPRLILPEKIGIDDPWGPNGEVAPQPSKPGGKIRRGKLEDPNQIKYHGTAKEFWKRDIAGTNTPYFQVTNPETGLAETWWYSMNATAATQKLVDSPDPNVGAAEIFGYNGTYPGSTFKTKVGQSVVVRHWNELPHEPWMDLVNLNNRESVHLHGNHGTAHADGYPSWVINPGNYRDYYYANTIPMGNDGKPDFGESPSTMWYHDHGMDLTDWHVAKGMAGFWLSFDDIELDLIRRKILPGWWRSTNEWNEDEFLSFNSPYDIPLALSDRRFNADGSIAYDGWPIGLSTDGYLGDINLVNGQSYPFMAVQPTQYRLRLLDGAQSRFYHLSIQDEAGIKQTHFRIGNDTWLLPQPLLMNEFTLGPAQRADLVMDFSNYAPGTVLYLVNTALQLTGRGPEGTNNTIGTAAAVPPGLAPFSERILKIVVGEPTPQMPIYNLQPSDSLRPHTPILPSEITNTRNFHFNRVGGLWVINQQTFDHHRSDNPIKFGAAEEWNLINDGGGWWHPIHIHLESHQLQDINGIAPSASFLPEKQWNSDTTLLAGKDTARIYMKFRTFEGPFVFHCHILQHEDQMMMYNFDPNLDGPTYTAGSPIPAAREETPLLFPHYQAPAVAPVAAPVGAAVATIGAAANAGEAAPADPVPLPAALLRAYKGLKWGTEENNKMDAKHHGAFLNGLGGRDRLNGSEGGDMLIGGDSDDLIKGHGGNDILVGGLGSDRMHGGLGSDIFRYLTADPKSIDTINDFDPLIDKLCFSFAMVETNGNNDTKFRIINEGRFSREAGEIRLENNLLQVDLDGDGRSDINIRLPNINSFTERMLDCLQ